MLDSEKQPNTLCSKGLGCFYSRVFFRCSFESNLTHVTISLS